MKLSDEKCREILKSPNNKTLIDEGRKYESRLRLFTETKFANELKSEIGWEELLRFLNDILSKKKYAKILKFFVFPLSSVKITKRCLTDLYKIFDARNSFFHTEFEKIAQKTQVNQYLNETDVLTWITEKGKAVIKNKPNSILVVDKDENGRPYLVLVDSKRLIDFDLRIGSNSEFEYIAFIHSIVNNPDGTKTTKYSFYDDQFYRVYNQIDSDFILVSEIKHTAGKCPARMFLTHKLNENNDYNRENPFSNSISKLMEFQVFDTYKFYADHYSAFPIIEAPEDKCGVQNCVKGKIIDQENYQDELGGELKTRTTFSDCEVCKSKELIGPGTIVRVQPRQDKDDPTESGVFKFISNPTENLDYIKDKLKSINDEIIKSTIGDDFASNQQAINEDQVQGSFESKTNILIDLKSNFDSLYKWTIETIVLLINPKIKVTVHADFGTEFYLLSEEDLQKMFENAIKIGLPDSEIDLIYKQYIETKYRGNIKKIETLKLIKKLDPLPYKTTDQAINLYEKGLISKKDLILKIGIVKFVERFESEEGSLIDFGSKLEESEKIGKITEILNKYTNEQIKSNDGTE